MIGRYFQSKSGLVTAVGDHLVGEVGRTVGAASAAAAGGDADASAMLLEAARSDPMAVRLLVRCALGDLRPDGFPACLVPERTGTGNAATDLHPSDRLRTYAVANLLLGWLTFERFIVPAVGLDDIGPDRLDRGIAEASSRIRSMRKLDPSLHSRSDPVRWADDPPIGPDARVDSRRALLLAAIESFSESGPASVSVRDIARRAGVNHGLIHRHFGSKDGLLSEAIEVGSAGLFPAALDPGGFDFDRMSALLHGDSIAPRLIARTIVDDIEITAVRNRFPVLNRLVESHGGPTVDADRPPTLDARVAAAATASLAMGSALWGPHLATALKLPDEVGIADLIATVARHLMSATDWSRGGDRGWTSTHRI